MLTVALSSIALIVLLAVVGGVLGWSLGLKGYWLVGMAGPFGFSAIAISSTLAPFTGLRWSVFPLLLTTVVLSACVFIVRRFVARSRGAVLDVTPGRIPWMLTAALIAAVLIGWRVLAAFGGAEAISQTFDNVFHLNAIRYVLDAGSASSLDVGALTGAMSFYPSVWHAAAALLVELTGATIPAAIQALTLVVSAVVWPLSALSLSAALLGATRAVLLSTGAVSAALPAFPLLMMDYGVLYPFQLSLALLPAALALTVRMLGTPSPDRGAVGWWALAFAGSLPGLLLSHPGGFVGWLALSVPLFVFFFIRVWRGARSTRRRWAVGAGIVAYLAIGLVLLKVLRPAVEARLWPPVMSPLDAVWDVLSVSVSIGIPSILVALAVILGVARALIGRSVPVWSALGMWAIGGGLFVVVASIGYWPVRDVLTGSWYNNWPRLAALFSVALVPLATVGLAWIADAIARALPRVPTGSAGVTTAVAAAVVVALIAQFPAMHPAQQAAHRQYVMGDDARLLSPDERALLERLGDEVPEDGVVAGNPYTGTSLAYAFSDRRVMMPHILMYLTAEGHAVNDGLDHAAEEPEICEAVRELGVTHVLDFGEREVHGERHLYEGLDDLATSESVELVDEQGEARLYRVVACGLN